MANLETVEVSSLGHFPKTLSILYMKFLAILCAALYVICCFLYQKRLHPASELILTPTTSMNGAHLHYAN